MKVTVSRYLTRDEALRRIREFKGGPSRKPAPEDIERATSILDTIKAYEEGEGAEMLTDERLSSIELLRKTLTPKRLDLLDHVSRGVDSVTELARKAGSRDIKNVHSDLQILRKAGFITLEKSGKKVVPKLLVASIRIEFQ